MADHGARSKLWRAEEGQEAPSATAEEVAETGGGEEEEKVVDDDA